MLLKVAGALILYGLALFLSGGMFVASIIALIACIKDRDSKSIPGVILALLLSFGFLSYLIGIAFEGG